MARPMKPGIDYFPFDVHFFDDKIMKGISGEFGAKGQLATVKLLCAVYQNGYFVVWDDLTRADIAGGIQGSTDLVDQVVSRLVKWGFFDKTLFDSAKVLTSLDIQSTYIEATKRRKQPKPTLYWINVDNNPPSAGVNDDINAQSKVKESKEKKNKRDSRQPRKRVYPDDSPEMRGAEYLWAKIKGNSPEHRKPNLQQWADDIRKMHELDDRPFDKIRNMIDWSQNDEFWSTNILSAAKLRAKYDTMAAQANRNWRPHKSFQQLKTKQPAWADPNYVAPAPKAASPELLASLAEKRARFAAEQEAIESKKGNDGYGKVSSQPSNL